MPITYHIELQDESAGARLDRALAATLAETVPELSRTRLQALIRSGAVTRQDGSVLDDPGLKVQRDWTLDVTIPDPEPAEPAGESIPLTILFEDDDIIVIDKPAGLVVHPAAGHETGTLVNALIAYCGDSLSGIGGVKRPGIVHRLDKDTSGVMVVAKTDLAHQVLAAQFADHGRTGPLERAYLALVWGVMDRPHGTVNAPLDRDTRNREKIAVVRPGKGREAITHWRVLETYSGIDGAPVASLVRCELETGRTHQIRVHLAHIGHPLLGDAVYGGGFRTKAVKLGPEGRAALDELGRQALHAALLGFAHPRTGAEHRFEAPLPADLSRLINALGA